MIALSYLYNQKDLKLTRFGVKKKNKENKDKEDKEDKRDKEYKEKKK